MYTSQSNYINSKKYTGPDCVEVDTGYITPCWIWRKAKTSAGYGMVTISRKQYYTHVLNYIEQYGIPPDGTELDHLCNMRACANPSHLEAVSHTENVRRGLRSKLTEVTVRLAVELRNNGVFCKDIAAMLGVHPSVIVEATNGTIWKGVL